LTATTENARNGEMDLTASCVHVYSIIFQGRHVYIFKVFIEYPLNLGSDCISMVSVKLTFDKTLTMQFCYSVFAEKNSEVAPLIKNCLVKGQIYRKH